MNRIILIGNGFDLAHGLKTSYKDFMDWYWDEWYNKLSKSPNSRESDALCEFGTNSSLCPWKELIEKQYSHIKATKGKNIVDEVSNIRNARNYTESAFMRNIRRAVHINTWVDIECEFYKLLKIWSVNNTSVDYNNCNLNQQLDYIKKELAIYLGNIQDSDISESILKPKVKEKILSPLCGNDICIDSKNTWHYFLEHRINKRDDEYFLGSLLSDYDGNNVCEKIDELNSFFRDYNPIINRGLINTISCDEYPNNLLLPDSIMILNFNYTNTADLYLPKSERFIINHIHGSLDNPEGIIFGYGDELDDKYSTIEKRNNNELLKNMKTIRYSETDNYRKMLSFIESAPYQIFIMGHSCGNSDRTLLNTLFEHNNCVSIKPFYYKREDGTDNYIELIQNISRNFTDMKKMRDRVVNKTYCEPLVGHK